MDSRNTLDLFLKDAAVTRQTFTEEPITKTINARFEIRIFKAYGCCRIQTPSMKTRDAILEYDFLLHLVGRSSRLYNC
jgi:hypothetical protein